MVFLWVFVFDLSVGAHWRLCPVMSFAGLNFSPTSDAPLSAIPVAMIPLSFNACDGTCAFLPSSLSTLLFSIYYSVLLTFGYDKSGELV